MKCGGSLIRNVYHNTDRTAPLSSLRRGIIGLFHGSPNLHHISICIVLVGRRERGRIWRFLRASVQLLSSIMNVILCKK